MSKIMSQSIITNEPIYMIVKRESRFTNARDRFPICTLSWALCFHHDKTLAQRVKDIMKKLKECKDYLIIQASFQKRDPSLIEKIL